MLLYFTKNASTQNDVHVYIYANLIWRHNAATPPVYMQYNVGMVLTWHIFHCATNKRCAFCDHLL